LVSISELFTKELLASVSALEKNCQGNIAQHTIIEYGIPLSGKWAILPKTIVNTKIVSRGRKALQAIPKNVCL
jgi:hypothetical protein